MLINTIENVIVMIILVPYYKLQHDNLSMAQGYATLLTNSTPKRQFKENLIS